MLSDPQHGHRCLGLPWCDRCFDVAMAEWIRTCRERRRIVRREFDGVSLDVLVASGVWAWMWGGPGQRPYRDQLDHV